MSTNYFSSSIHITFFMYSTSDKQLKLKGQKKKGNKLYFDSYEDFSLFSYFF